MNNKTPFVVMVKDLRDKYNLTDVEVQEPIYAETYDLRAIKPRETLKVSVN